MQCPQWGIGLWPILRSPDVASCQWMIRICLQSIDSSNFSKSVNKEAHIWPVLLEGFWQCFLNFYQRSHFGEKFSHLCILALLARSFAWKSMPVEANRWSSKETEQTHWSASWTGNYPAEKPHFLKLGRLPINISNRSLYSIRIRQNMSKRPHWEHRKGSPGPLPWRKSGAIVLSACLEVFPVVPMIQISATILDLRYI